MKKSDKILIIVNLVLVVVLFVMISSYSANKKDMEEKQKLDSEFITTSRPITTPTPKPTASPDASKKPENTRLPENTQSAVPTISPTVIPTVTPTATPTATPQVTQSPVPTDEPQPEGPQYTVVPVKTKAPNGAITLVFGGDVLLSESMTNTYSKNNGKGLNNVLSKALISEFQNADVAMVNQEFPFSTRGEKMANKQYTFRANPKYVNLFTDMGIDVVSLANNHTLDYGRDAFDDTFSTLDEAGIEYIGAGENLDRAKESFTIDVGGKIITYLAASRVLPVGDWYASDNKSGIFSTYDTTLLCQEIKEAEEYSDFTVVYVHWGVEHNSMPEAYQRNMAKEYIDAGADAVIGCHTHCLQGVEYYKGKPVIYSLGNFMFGAQIDKTLLYKLVIAGDDVSVNITPCKSSGYKTFELTNAKEKESFFKEFQKICFNAQVDSNGDIKEYIE